MLKKRIRFTTTAKSRWPAGPATGATQTTCQSLTGHSSNRVAGLFLCPLVDVLAVPELQGEQREYSPAQIIPARRVLANDAFNVFGDKIPAPERGRIEQDRADIVEQRTAKPAGDRHRKTAFSPVNDVAR